MCARVITDVYLYVRVHVRSNTETFMLVCVCVRTVLFCLYAYKLYPILPNRVLRTILFFLSDNKQKKEKGKNEKDEKNAPDYPLRCKLGARAFFFVHWYVCVCKCVRV